MSTPLAIPEMKVWKPSVIAARISRSSEATFIEQTMQSDTLTTVDGTTMKMLVDRIHVRNDGVVVEFKCGVAIEQEYVK